MPGNPQYRRQPRTKMSRNPRPHRTDRQEPHAQAEGSYSENRLKPAPTISQRRDKIGKTPPGPPPGVGGATAVPASAADVAGTHGEAWPAHRPPQGDSMARAQPAREPLFIAMNPRPA